MFVCCAFYTQTINLNHTVKITIVWDIMAYIIIIIIVVVVVFVFVGGGGGGGGDGVVKFIYLRGC